MGTSSRQHGQIVPLKDSQEKKSVLFVCAANQCRSPMAMILFKDLVSKKTAQPKDWSIESAGVWARNGYSATDFAIQAVKDYGLDLSDHQSQPVTEALLKNFNLILCMENEQVSFIKRNFPKAEAKVFLLSEMRSEETEIWDPVGYSQDSYRDTAQDILLILEKGFDKILSLS